MREIGEIAALVAAGIVPNLAYASVGLWIARRLAPETRGAETIALGFVLGSGFASLAILLLRLADVPVPLFPLFGLVLLTLPEWRHVLRRAPASVRGVPSWARGVPSSARGVPSWARGVDALTLVVGVLLFTSALGPETFWDGFEYHLPMIAAWCEGPIRSLPGLVDAEFRAGVDLLYVPAVAAGQADAAASVSACFAGCLAALVRAEVRRRATAGAGAVAGLFVLLAPFALDNAASSYVDLGVGAYGFLALLSVDRWNRLARDRDLLLAAVYLGLAANAKLHAAALAPALLAMLLLGGRPLRWGQLLRCAAIVLALVAPWLVKAALTSGNPFFPLFGEVFGTGFASQEHLSLRRFRLSTDYPARGPLSFAQYLVSLTFGRNPHLSGQLGALPLALLPAALHRLSRPTIVLAATLFVLAGLQFVFMPALRFGAPLLPFVAIGAAVGGARLARSSRRIALVLGVLLTALAIHHGASAVTDHLPRIVSLPAPEAHQTRVFPDQMALRDLVAQGRGVVAIPKGAVQWMTRPVYLLHWERNGELFFDPLLGRQTGPEEALALLRLRGVRSLVVEARSPLPTPKRVGHPSVDAWIAAGLAARRPDVAPRPTRGDHVLVLVDLL